MGDDCIESAARAKIADLQDSAYCAVESGRDDLAESINRALIAARVEFADVLVCDD